jgi:hypothetical protein
MARLLPRGGPRIILHAGDFGIWPGLAGQRYQAMVTAALAEADAGLWFADGNHEDFSQIASFDRREDGRNAVAASGDGIVRIWHLPRGYRWKWHGRTWLAVGGAVSVDRDVRTEGVDWWPEEEITDEQEARACRDGVADVLLSHDAPAGVPLYLMRPAPVLWRPHIPRAEAHRERLHRICMATRPAHVIFGHYHQRYKRVLDAGWGLCEFTGLDMDGEQGNWQILDTRTVKRTAAVNAIE